MTRRRVAFAKLTRAGFVFAHHCTQHPAPIVIINKRVNKKGKNTNYVRIARRGDYFQSECFNGIEKLLAKPALRHDGQKRLIVHYCSKKIANVISSH